MAIEHADEAIGARRRLFPAPRIAVSMFFLVNGYLLGSWAPKVPEFLERLNLTESELGLLILVLGAGALSAMPVVGALVAAGGSTRIGKLSALLAAPAIVYVTLPSNIWLAGVAIFLLGGCIGGMDIAMNANAVSVERSMKRAIMSSCHGFWSLGGLIGAGTGGFLIEAWGLMGHALFTAAFAYTGIFLVWRHVMEDRSVDDQEEKPLIRLPRALLPYLLGIMALFSMVPEGAVLDWGALYLRRELGADIALSGFGFAAFSATMAIMRFGGDPIRDRLGAVRTMRACTIVAIIGMLIAGFATSAAVAVVGFALCGVGIANMVPIAFSAAGNMPGLAPGIGLSVVTFMGYSGILFAPSLIGFVAEYTGFALIFQSLPVLFAVVLLLSGLARHADLGGDDQD